MRRRSNTSSDLSFVIVVLVGSFAWTHRAQLVHMAYVAFGVMDCLLLLRLFWKLVTRGRFAEPRDTDSMNGLEFEQYVAKLLQASGLRNVSLTEKYDFGVDIIAEKDGIRWGIQIKRHSGLVKASAVRRVVTRLNLYDCDRAMVITNSNYSTVARRLADANDCVLVDRTRLKQLARQRCIL